MRSYDDMLFLPHHVSSRHPQMSVSDRAAQFSPFAALPGYGDVIAEAGRHTETKARLSDEERACIDSMIRESVGCAASITYFIPDGRKDGGHYAEIESVIKCADDVSGCIVLADGRRIRGEDVIRVVRREDGSLHD